MKRNAIVLVTDIDNTIYDFIDAYAPAFRAMVHVVAKATNQPETLITDQFRVLFKEVGTLDFQNLIRNLDVSKRLAEQDVARIVVHGRRAFDITRRAHQVPYVGIADALSAITRAGVVLIGATNAPVYHALSRLQKLRCFEYFSGLIAWEGVRLRPNHPLYDAKFEEKLARSVTIARGKLRYLQTFAKSLSKPHPYVFESIHTRFGNATYFVLGDSISKDLTPAVDLGMRTIWAKYGTLVDEKNLRTILEITPWSEAEVQHHDARDREPDYVINSPVELLRIVPSSPPPSDLPLPPSQTDLFQ